MDEDMCVFWEAYLCAPGWFLALLKALQEKMKRSRLSPPDVVDERSIVRAYLLNRATSSVHLLRAKYSSP